jgi:hypothetical protein
MTFNLNTFFITTMKKYLSLTLLIFLTTYVFAQQPLFRYYNSKINKHYYTINFNEFGNGANGWAFEKIACLVFATGEKNRVSVPFFRYFNPKNGDHFYTAQLGELGPGDLGYRLEGPVCFIFRFRVPGTVAFFRYFNQRNGDHFYTTDRKELGMGYEGYVFEKVAGFVFPK